MEAIACGKLIYRQDDIRWTLNLKCQDTSHSLEDGLDKEPIDIIRWHSTGQTVVLGRMLYVGVAETPRFASVMCYRFSSSNMVIDVIADKYWQWSGWR